MAVVGVWFALFFLAERLAPAAPRIGAVANPWLRLGANASFWIANFFLSLAIVLPLTKWAAELGTAPSWRPEFWQGWAGLALDIVLLDGMIYWWHRANHRVGFLWRFHEIHHLDRTLDSTTAVRFHFGEVLLSTLARAAVIALLGFALTTIVIFETLLLVATIFHHSNLRLPPAFERILSRAIVTPSIHWVHHHRRQPDTDANYSTLFSWWDRLFGSRSPTQRTPAMDIGVEGRDEQVVVRLFGRPFGAR